MEDRPDGPGYDYCPKDKVMVCPPGAEKNEECLCIDKPDQEKKDLWF